MTEPMWGKAEVEAAIQYFNNTDQVSDGDRQGLAKLAVRFDRFAAMVDDGKIQAGEPRQLADTFLKTAQAWFEKNPSVKKDKDLVWTTAKVEKAILYFNDTDAVPATDKDGMKKLIGEFKAFEAAIQGGWVEDGPAKELADAFLKRSQEWFDENPAFQKLYKA